MTRMLFLSVCLTIALAAPFASFAQEQGDGASAEAAAPRQAVPRESRPQGDNPQTGTARPRESRPQGDNPRTGTAVPRREVSRQPEPRRAPPPQRIPSPPRTVIVQPPPVYNNYYYYPRRYYPYGYGAFGLGYFYYDPYRWYPGYSAFPYSGFGNPYSVFSAFDVGELRLQVTPRSAQVYVDGYYAGSVDDFDGMFQSLKMQAGPYHIEITAPGYETLEVDVRLTPGQKMTYRGDLRRLP